MKSLLRLFAVVALLFASASAQQSPRLDPRKVNIDRMLIDPYSYWNQPYSFYYFRHMDEVDGLRIDWLRKPNRPYVLARSTATLAPTYTVEGATHALDDYLSKANVIAFVVLKDNQLVYEKYLHDAVPADRFISFSIGKSVTSVLFGIAMDEGKIQSVKDTVTKYLPELKGTHYDAVTIENLLRMASGIRYDEQYLEEKSDVHTLLHVLMKGDRTFVDLAAEYGKREPERKPGTEFDYQSIDTQLLTEILERAVGMRMSKYGEEKLWKKVGAESDAFLFQSERLKSTCGFACFNATARDYARFALMAMNRGELGGTRIVSEQWMRESTTAPPYANNYGYQWWLNVGSKDGAFRAVGIYGQTLYVNPAKRVVIAQFSARPAPGGRPPTPLPPAPFDAIASQLTP
jgi:CubicO group peptidase (beta-lactamase class C family)